MLRSHLIMAALFKSMLVFGCTDSGTPIANGVAPTSNAFSPDVGINGPHVGDIWITRESGTDKFNLQTSEQTEVSIGYAYPSKDGSVFLEYLKDDGIIRHNFCPIPPSYYDAQTFNLKNTRSGEVLSSFTLGTDVSQSSIRLSPDGQRIAMDVAEDTQACEENDKTKRFSIYSIDGKQLYRNTGDYFTAFDWHPDGRLIIVKKLSGTERQFAVQIETKPGSFEFTDLLFFTAPLEVIYYTGLRVSPTGNSAVIEAVSQDPVLLSGVFYRNAKAHHFPLFEDFSETNLFEHGESEAQVNGPTFSPDGKHILVTEGYTSGAPIFFENYPDLDQVADTSLIVPLSTASLSYIVQADAKLQPMPPRQYSETIRPVVAVDGNWRGLVGFYPLVGLSWTPPVN